jgi:AraC-like DNA-binding protein
MSWTGAAVIEPGRLVYRGVLGDTHRHAHAAVQIAIALDGALRITDALDRQISGTAAVIPAGAQHTVNGGTSTGLLIYLEPTSFEGRGLGTLFDDTSRNDAAAWCAAAALGSIENQDLSTAADAIVTRLVGDVCASEPHASVREAIRLLPDMLTGPLRLSDVAAAVHLSADRLGRMFARDTGMSFPAYIRWARLIRIIEVARAGGTLTDAAHAAGFTDSSHANRAFHEMFGITPVELHRSVQLS